MVAAGALQVDPVARFAHPCVAVAAVAVAVAAFLALVTAVVAAKKTELEDEQIDYLAMRTSWLSAALS